MRRDTQLEQTSFVGPALGVFALGLAIRALHLWQLRGSPLVQVHLGDAAGYHAWAQRIAAGDWFGTDVFYQAPLYPYVLSLVYATLGEAWAPRVVQALLGSLACVLLALAGRRIFSRQAGLIAGVGLAIYPTAVFFDGLIQKSVLANLLICLLLWLLSRTMIPPESERGWLWAGLALGALVLTRENALVLLVPMGLWLAFGSGLAPRKKLVATSLLVAGLALTLGPVALRNVAVGGGFHLTTSQSGPNFYIGNRTGASGKYEALRYGRGSVTFERDDATHLAEEGLGRKLSPAEVSDYWRDRAFADIRAQPASWLRLMARKFALVWNAAEIEDTEDQATYSELSLALRGAWVFHFGVLAPIAVLGVWLSRRRWRQLWLLYGLIVVYAASVALFFVFARYRFPLVPLLMLFAAAGVSEARQLFRAFPRRELAYGVAALLAVAVFCNWPLVSGGTSSQVTTQVNLARALTEKGDLKEAAKYLERALELDADHPLAHSNLADVLYLQGDFERAISHYRVALAASPEDSRSHNNLGLALAAGEDAEGALEHYQQAVDLDPRHAEALSNLAGALAQRGRLSEALSRYSEAVEADPDYVLAYLNRATVLAAYGRLEEALETLTTAAQVAPRDADVHKERGRLNTRLERHGGAIAAYRRALELSPGSADVHHELGGILGRGEGLEHLMEAARLEPTPQHLVDAALALVDHPQVEPREARQALDFAERAVVLTEGRDPAVLAVLAEAQAAMGNYDFAVKTARQALILAERARATSLIPRLRSQVDRYAHGEPFYGLTDRGS